jgi:hypothetical protein
MDPFNCGSCGYSCYDALSQDGGLDDAGIAACSLDDGGAPVCTSP